MPPAQTSFQDTPAVRSLAVHRLFQELPADVLASLAGAAVPHRANAGRLLFHEGDEAHEYLLVGSGSIEVLRFGLNGDERVFGVFTEGQLVAEAAMFMPHGRYPMTARAQTDAVYFRLGRKPLLQACEQHSMLAMRMLSTLSQRLYRRVNDVDWLTVSSASQRLAAYLLRQREQQGAEIELPFSQRQLAAQLGMRAETLSRLFTEWLDRGYVSGKRRSWVLRNETFLRSLAGGEARTF